MRPEVDTLLSGSFTAIMTSILMNPTAPYGLGSLGTIGMIMLFSAQEYERAAEVRFNENRRLRALFARAAASVNDAALAKRLTDAAEESDASLRISALDRSNDALLTLLIALQAHLETRRDAAARALLQETWDFLLASARERSLELPAA